jgi:ABC-type nitrate/sulfonate/bicarbonate transport system permease component
MLNLQESAGEVRVDASVDAALTSASTGSRATRRIRKAALRIGKFWLLALFLVVWQLISSANSSLQLLLPPPSAVLTAGWELLKNGVLLQDIAVSLTRVFTAVGIAALIGIPLGAAMGGLPRFRWSFDPLLEFIRPIPPLAWIPLAILWFGISEKEIDFIIFLAAFFPIVLNSAAGFRDVDMLLVRAARSLGANPFVVFWTVYVPAALSHIIIGIRTGMGIGWMALVAGELVGATTGLGFLISQGRMVFRSDFILLGMVTIGVLGLALDGLIRGVSAALMPWKR